MTHSPLQLKRITAWTWYDWANSVYSLTITSAVFPAYYTAVTTHHNSDIINFFGLNIQNTVLYSWALSFAFLISAFLTPILSGIADYGGNKKIFLKSFCYLGSLACLGLGFFDGDNVEWGILCFMLASIGFSGSLVFYNAFLPEICTPAEMDKVSARGFSMGYIGSVILLIINLAMIQFPDALGIPSGTWPARISFFMVGLWWAGFAQITFFNLPPEKSQSTIHKKWIYHGFQELRKVYIDLNQNKLLKRYLFSFFFYSIGMQTVLYMATLFGTKELKLETSDLIITILLIQFVGIIGAYLFAWLATKIGNFQTLIIALIIWTGVCIGAWFTNSREDFFLLAGIVGIVMGGTQSLSRSTFSKKLPVTLDHASYFSFLDVSEKLSIVIGMAGYGFIEAATGSMRNSIIALLFFFLVGIGGLVYLIKKNKFNEVGV